MAEFFENKYVVKIGTGHPGKKVYTIITTPKQMALMLQELERELAKHNADPSAHSIDIPGPNYPRITTSLFILWHQYVTTAYGDTSRVSLNVAVSDDLSQFHHRPKRTRDLPFYFGCLGLVGLVVLAWIGIKALISGYHPAW